jgi:hypothetical protein
LHCFYVEFRFHGYPKEYLRGLIREVASKFRVKGALKYRPVPHMTLYGPSVSKSYYDTFSRIERVAKRYTLVPFTICDFDCRSSKNGKVIACRINASPELKNLRRELAGELNKIIEMDYRQPWDNVGDYWFHTTIAMNDIDRRFEDICSYVNRKEKPDISQYLVRITVLNRRRRIEREYDLMLRQWLNRREALSRHLWRKTVNKLRELQGLPPERPPSIVDRLRRILGFRDH